MLKAFGRSIISDYIGDNPSMSENDWRMFKIATLKAFGRCIISDYIGGHPSMS